MGQCYYVEISLRYKKAQTVAEALTKYLVEQKVLEKMPDMNTFDLKCAMFELTCDMEERHKDEAPIFTDTKFYYDATFNASYGYECILCGALDAIADTVEDGSFIEIWPDYGYTKFIKENGEVEAYGLDTNPTPCLYDSGDVLEIMEDEECQGIYNVKTEDLLYTTDNISYMYAKISKSKAIELSKQSKVTQENEWLKYAAPIAKNIGEDEEACEFIDENIFDNEDQTMPERWILVTPYTVDYISVFG